jgi:hypothetical protein
MYTREDLERVRLMQRHLAAGLAAAEAARLAVEIRADTDRAGTTVFDAMAARAELGAALEHFDEPAAQAVFDRVLAVATLDSHDIGLVAFGLALHARGWRIHFLAPTRRSKASPMPHAR